jgi:hypothetical protein
MVSTAYRIARYVEPQKIYTTSNAAQIFHFIGSLPRSGMMTQPIIQRNLLQATHFLPTASFHFSPFPVRRGAGSERASSTNLYRHLEGGLEL